MIKKIAPLMMLGLILALSTANIAMAQAGAFPQEALDAFAKEPPLTQADVDLYMKAMPKIPAAIGNPQALEQLYTDLGLTEIRFSFIVARIGIAHSLALNVSPEQLGLANLPEIVRPTESDKALVAKNLDELTRVTMEAQQSAAAAQ